MCVLERNYGTVDAPFTLMLKPIPLTDRVSVFLVWKKQSVFTPNKGLTMGFGPAAETVSRSGSADYFPDLKLTKFSTYLTRNELARGFSSGLISFDAGGLVNDTLAIPQLAEALKVIDQCQSELLEDWGLSAADQARMAKAPQPIVPFENILSGNDYPMDAVRSNASGRASVFVRVDSGGKPGGCRVVHSSGHKSLDDASCRTLLRAKYWPAMDKTGQPMDSLYVQDLTWRVTAR
jgi:TonB family protein